MKNYYNRQSKEKRKEIKIKFLKDESSTLYQKANRVFIISTLGIIVSTISFIFDYKYKTSTLNIIIDLGLLCFCLIFFFLMLNTKNKEINKYALRSKKWNINTI